MLRLEQRYKDIEIKQNELKPYVKEYEDGLTYIAEKEKQLKRYEDMVIVAHDEQHKAYIGKRQQFEADTRKLEIQAEEEADEWVSV